MYTVGRLSERETSNGEGVEFVSDELTAAGLRVTKKLYHLSSRLPLFVRLVLPKTAMVLTEDAWRSTALGTSCTEIRNEYMAHNLTLRVETKVFECDDATRPNVFELDAARLKLREVQDIDWVVEETPAPDDKDYVAAEDARVFRSAKSRRHPGPLAADWRAATLAAADKKAHPWICVYKLLTFEFKWFGIQTRAEAFLVGWERNLFTKSQRLTWCLQDEWHDMTQEQIEDYLDTIAARINKQFRKASGVDENDTKQRDDADNTNNNLPIAVRLQRRQSARPGALYCPRMDRLEPETMVKVIEVASPHAVHRVRVRQLRVVRGARPARWRNGVCGCLLVAMLAILFSSLSASRLTAAPLPAGHSLADAVRQHRLLGDSGAPFSVFWAAQLSRDDELNRLLSSDVASTVVRVRQCDSADLATVHAWQLRLMSAAAAPSSESLLVLVDDACAPKCQDALTMWLDDSLPLVRGSARHLYYVLLTGAHGECTREALAARLAHRIMNFV